MQRTIPSSASAAYAKVYTAHATDSSFASRPDAAAAPSGSGVVTLTGADTAVAGPAGVTNAALTWARFEFFAAGSDGDSFDVRIYGVAASGGGWTYTPLFEGTATLGTRTGVAGSNVGASELYADTLVAAGTPFGVADSSFRVVSPGDNTKARLLLDTEGFGFLRVDFKRVSGTPSMNALYAGV